MGHLHRLSNQLVRIVVEAESESSSGSDSEKLYEFYGHSGVWRTTKDGHKIFIVRDKATGEDLGVIYPNPSMAAAIGGIEANPDALDTFKSNVPEYNLTIVAGADKDLSKADIDRAIEVKKRLTAGIAESADFCKLKPSICKGNLGITRDNMPQIMDDPLSKLLASDDESDRKKAKAAIAAGADPNDKRSIKQQWVAALEKSGVKITDEQVPVGKMRASQAEIKAGKSYGMAESQLRGFDRKTGRKTDFTKMPLLVTKEKDENGEDVYTVIDGHHRFAAMLLVDPEAKQAVRVINAPIREALEKSFDLPGVFRADLQDNIVSMDKPLDLSRKNGSTWKQKSNGKFYAKNKSGDTGGPYETIESAKKFASGR
jgi:hypothetical protein